VQITDSDVNSQIMSELNGSVKEPNIYLYFYYLRWRMPPFMRQCWGLQYAVLPSSWVNSSVPLVCRHDRV